MVTWGTLRRHGKEVNADLINAATRLYWEDAKRVCVRDGGEGCAESEASCPKPGSRQKTPVRGGGGAAKEARGRRAGSAQETFAREALWKHHRHV